MTRRVLLAGLGQIGMGYDVAWPAASVLTHARAASVHPSFDLIAAVDPLVERRERFKATYGVPAYPTLELALEAHHPEVVVIAGPTDQHGEMVRTLLRLQTPKALLCEKPLAVELVEARSLVASCAERNVSLYVNYVRQSDPGVIEVKRRLEAGEIRGPVKGVVWYSKGLLHNGSHFFNLLQYWVGPFERGAIFDRGRLWEGRDPEPGIHAVFKHGSVVFVAAREEDYSHYTVELIAANGRLRYDDGGALITWQPARRGLLSASVPSLAEPEVIPSGMARYQWHVMEQLDRALNGLDAAICSGADALAAQEAMSSLLENR